MSRRVLAIARREVLEQWRQPWMLLVIAALYALVSGLAVASLWLIEWLRAQPASLGMWEAVGGPSVAELPELQQRVLWMLSFLGFAQYLGTASVLAGHGLLHDRQCGTLPFLLLSPVHRGELLLGKLLGALALPTALYWVIVGAASAIAALAPVAAEAPWWVPRSATWWVAFLVGAPAWAGATGSACTLVSAVARDVRAAQQGVWFIVFFATLGAGSALTGALSSGLFAQLVGAFAALGVSGMGVYVGALLLGRDLSR